MAFLPTGALLVTDRNGKIFKIEGQEAIELKNVPEVNSKNQGGMLDIVLDPAFDSNQFIYVSYSKVHPEDAELTTTAVSRYILSEDGLEEAVEIFEATPYESTNHHFGSRLVFGDDGYLYITVGDRGKRDDNPQDLTRSPGKVHRIKSDGTIPEDNPFVANPDAVASIYSYGHRNPQGMIKDPATGNMWAHEHGPRGGDEINEIVAGNNYGWPVISYGINYNGTVFTTETEREGMEQPKHYWVPSIGPSGMAYVTSERYPNWKNHLLSGSLKYGFVSVMPLRGGSLGDETRLLEGVGRTRSIVQSPDGYLYIGFRNFNQIKGNFFYRFFDFMHIMKSYTLGKMGLHFNGSSANVSYPKTLFYSTNGFVHHMNIPFGETRLFANEVAKKSNTTFCLHPNAEVTHVQNPSFKSWFREQRKNELILRRCKIVAQLSNGVLFLCRLTFFSLACILLIFGTPKIQFASAVLISVRFLVQYISFGIVAKKLSVLKLIIALPLFELWHLATQFIIFISSLKSKRLYWN
ncbi:MAG: hypothetical protein EB076_08795 [Flavobacteriia bacterium]|nr:hypothetical protein [Flavobacteriia bacterium]